MEEIDLKELFKYYKKRIQKICLVFLICIFCAFFYNYVLSPKVYTGTIKVAISSKTDAVTQNDITFNQKFINSYNQLLTSKSVIEKTIKETGINYSYSELSKNVDMKLIDNTEMVTLTVKTNKEDSTISVAYELIEELRTKLKDKYNLNRVEAMDDVAISYDTSIKNCLKPSLIFAVVVTVVYIGVLFVIYYFDDSFKETKTLEEILELPVIGKVKNSSDNDVKNIKEIEELRNNLNYSSIDDGLNTLLITSTTKDEGKSYVSTNLAYSFANDDKKVLLVDCDLKNGSLNKKFVINKKEGLSDLLTDDINHFSDYLIKSKTTGIYLMPSGTSVKNPAELLNSNKFADLLEKLKAHFDLIILDGDVATPLSGSVAVADQVDRTLLITRIKKTSRTDVINAKKVLVENGAKIVGVVDNQKDDKKHKIDL